MPAAPAAPASNRQREVAATLGAGLFTNAVWDMFTVLAPLYAVAVGLNAAEVGLVVAARSLLPALLSIHGGILADIFGTRRMLRWVAIACLLLPLLYPVSGWFVVLVLLQLITGLASSFGMATSQVWAMHVGRGDTALLANYSVATRVGTFLGPVAVGAAWDFFGAWVAFACIAVCGAGTLWSLAAMRGEAEPPMPASRAVLLPQWEPHKRALLLAAVPAVAFLLGASFLRNTAGAIQSSIYVMYLNGVGYTGTLIGTLVAIAELSGVAGSLVAARAERRLGAVRLVIVCIVVSILCMTATPLLAGAYAALATACVVRGIVQGMSQPLMYAILSTEVASNQQGASVGLRNAVVRLGSMLTPAVMGVVAERYGIVVSFYVMGAAFLVAAAGLAVFARRIRL
jgi:MFS family permease